MFALLLGIPNWIKATAVGLVLVGGLQVKHHFEIKGLQAQLIQAKQETKEAQQLLGELRNALSVSQAALREVRQQVDAQNAAITLWQTRAKQAESTATTRALRVLQTGTQRAEVLRTAVGGLGPEGLNTWLRARFAS